MTPWQRAGIALFGLVAALVSAPAAGLAQPDGTTARLETLAADGDAYAAYMLYRRHLADTADGASPSAAIRWLERAAALGLTKAHLDLADRYRTGDGVAVDATRARRHYARVLRAGSDLERQRARRALATLPDRAGTEAPALHAGGTPVTGADERVSLPALPAHLELLASVGPDLPGMAVYTERRARSERGPRWFAQLGSFAEPGGALRRLAAVGRLRGDGPGAPQGRIETVATADGGQMQRVLVGPFSDEAAADAFCAAAAGISPGCFARRRAE